MQIIRTGGCGGSGSDRIWQLALLLDVEEIVATGNAASDCVETSCVSVYVRVSGSINVTD
jgi:hypothetical protein